MNVLHVLAVLTVFPGGLTVLLLGLLYEWVDRKLVARFQNRLGPPWYQAIADTAKLLAKVEIMPEGVNHFLFNVLPVIALAGAMTAALYVPLLGGVPAYSFSGDLIVTVYLMSLLTLCTVLAGANTANQFALIGASRTLTQLFAYEAPFLLALIGPALAAQSWQISKIAGYADTHLLILAQPIGFIVALFGLMGKLELHPFDSPEAHTEIVAGTFTEYSGRGLAIFHLGRNVELVIGIALISAFYLGGIGNIFTFVFKALALLFIFAGLQSVLVRFRIDQTVGVWWRFGALLALGQLALVMVLR